MAIEARVGAVYPAAPKLDLISVVARLRAWMRAHAVMRDDDPPIRVTIDIGSRDAAGAAVMQLKRELEPLMMYMGSGSPHDVDLDLPMKIMGIEITFRSVERRALPNMRYPSGDGADRRYASDIADWCERELTAARQSGRLETRPFVQNVQLIVAALREYSANEPLPPMSEGPAGDRGQVGWMGGEFDR